MDKIPFHHFGGQGPVVSIGHANSFPPGMYRKMVEPLLSDFTVVGMESRPLWPGSSTEGVKSWADLSKDLVTFIEENGWSKVHVLGHSLGAAKIIFASLDRPDLFDKVVLVEPPFLPKWLFNLSALMPIELRKKVIPPSRVANNRTDQWPGAQDFFDYIRPKPVFEKISDEVLWDYVNHVHEVRMDNIALRYPKSWESHVYAVLSSPWEALAKMDQEVLAVRGVNSDVISKRSWEKWRRIQRRGIFENISGGGHLIPFEKPREVGERVLKFLLTGQ